MKQTAWNISSYQHRLAQFFFFSMHCGTSVVPYVREYGKNVVGGTDKKELRGDKEKHMSHSKRYTLCSLYTYTMFAGWEQLVCLLCTLFFCIARWKFRRVALFLKVCQHMAASGRMVNWTRRTQQSGREVHVKQIGGFTHKYKHQRTSCCLLTSAINFFPSTD